MKTAPAPVRELSLFDPPAGANPEPAEMDVSSLSGLPMPQTTPQ